MRLIFLGPPGAGKGTIADMAKDFFNIPHISTGDLFRNNIKNRTPLGKEVKSILDSGGLVPDELTVEMVKDRLKQDDTNQGFILDGFPRTIHQADALSEFTDIQYVINFIVSEEKIIKRLSGRRVAKHSGKIYHIIYNPPKEENKCDITGEPLIQRPDDKEDAIKNRLSVYRKQTEPLIEYYRDKGLLLDVDGEKTPEEVFKEFKKVIKSQA